MDVDLIVRWVDALRSGKYKQGKGNLRDLNDQYCCLGVLCDIYDPTPWQNATTFYMYKNMGSYLPSEMSIKTPIDQFTLTKMNDIENKNFDEIADYIEKEYLV